VVEVRKKSYIYVIEDEAHLARMRRLAKRHGGELRCDIRVRDVVFSRVSRSRGSKTTRRCALCYDKAFGDLNDRF
jgi:hypothetical protein